MGTPRPNMFIASSTKGLDCAEAVASQFKDDVDVDIWTNEDVFKLNTSYLETLLNRASYSDFAVALFTADDTAVIKDKAARVARDNVIFEFGLFLGRLGLDRTFFIMERDVELFSDWAGIKSAKFSRNSLDVDIRAACDKIRTAMTESAQREQFSVLPSTSLAVGYYNNFLAKVLGDLRAMDSIEMIKRDSKGREVGRHTYDISNQRPIIHVKVPQNLADLESETWKDHTGSYTLIAVPTPSRPYPFYIKGDFAKEGESVELFDVPTTLLASRLAIQEIFDKRFLTSGNTQTRLETREISNFKTTLRLMIKEKGQQKFFRVSDWDPHDS